MKLLRCLSWALFCAVIPAASAQALQSFLLAVDARRGDQDRIRGSVQVQVPPRPLRVVAAEPFSALETREQVRLLPDGSHQKVTLAPHRIFRDSFGRTRIERPLIETDPDSPALVEINDPGGGVYYLLDPIHQVAYRVEYAPPRLTPLADEDSPPPVKFQAFLVTPGGRAGGDVVPVVESLGTRTIQGVEAEGKRSTVTRPVNPARTSDTFSRVTETWVSPELEITLRETMTDPRSGDSKFEVTELLRESPPRGLFEPPPDYRVVDQQGFFGFELN